MKWNEVIRVVSDYYGESKSDQEIADMTWSDRCHYIKLNPVIVARHVDYMFHRLFRAVILSAPHPVAQVLDYEVKKEFQARGSVHFHMAIWVKDAPKLDIDEDSEVIQFIDKYVSCQKPDDATLAQHVTELQSTIIRAPAKEMALVDFIFQNRRQQKQLYVANLSHQKK